MASIIEPFLKQKFPQYYAGLQVNQACRVLTIFRIPDRVLDSTVRSLVKSVSVSFINAKFSYEQMSRVATKITSDMSYWKGQGIDIETITPEFDGSGVEIGTPQESEAQAKMPPRYDAGILKFTNHQVAPIAFIAG